MRFIDITGMKFNRLTVLKRVVVYRYRTQWECKCECGNIVIVDGTKLKSGHTKSCGCWMREATIKASTTHGMAKKNSEYGTWENLKKRCNDLDDPNYGGRGITVCDEWKDDFAQFYQDMGPKPSPKHSIERIDVNGNYEPNNCRWATNLEQQSNKRNNVWWTFNGETKTQAEWARVTGINPRRILRRIKAGWSVEKTLSTSIKKQKNNTKK